jgi:nucleoid-associated protein YejK
MQERSSRALNAPGRLALIAKALHQPLVDFSDEAQLSATLEREMEEELFGRSDVYSTDQVHRSADPMHISRLSEPMRWLMEHADNDTWRTEKQDLASTR